MDRRDFLRLGLGGAAFSAAGLTLPAWARRGPATIAVSLVAEAYTRTLVDEDLASMAARRKRLEAERAEVPEGAGEEADGGQREERQRGAQRA